MEFDNKVLVIGDSIARHYFPYTHEELAKYEIEGVTSDKWVSCQWKQLRFLDKSLEKKRRYGGRKIKAETVHFNFGLHSIKLPNKGHDPDHQRATDEDFEVYERELREAIEFIRKLQVKPIFSNTTPNPKNAGMRKDADVVILNEIAKQITDEMGVSLNDLYSFVKAQEDYPRLYMHPRNENNCHFEEHGRKLLGENVAKFIVDSMNDEQSV
jgi:hypothetical protein